MLKLLSLNRWYLVISSAFLVFAVVIVHGDEPTADPTKRRVEVNTERVLAGTRPAAADLAKHRAKSDVGAPAEMLVTASSTTSGDFVNVKVEPGKVKWHATFDAACAAVRRSGKPVLLFQMMGKLDDQFC